MSSEKVATPDDVPAEEAPSAPDPPQVEETPEPGPAILEAPSSDPQSEDHANPEPSQFPEDPSDHAGENIKHAKSGSVGSASKARLASLKPTSSGSKMQPSPSKAGIHIELPPKELTSSKTTTSKHAISYSEADATEAAETFDPPPKDRGSISPTREVSMTRRGSHMRSMTSEDRLGRKYSGRRSSSFRTHGTLTGSIISFRRTSGDVERSKIPRMQNTYRMESKRPFNADCVATILREVLDKECETERYDACKSPRFAMALTSEIRSRIKQQHFERYKIIVYVTVCEKQQQSINSSLRFMWDPEKDNYTTYSYENPTMFVVASAFGVYYE